MRLRRFEAATVTEALEQVRADLGPEAIILHARSTGVGQAGGGVEVTAAVDEDRPGSRGGLRPDVGTGEAPCGPEAAPDVLPEDRAGEGESPDALQEIHRLLLEVRAEVGPSSKLPVPLRPAYRHLLSQDVPAGVARQFLLGLPPGIRSRRRPPDSDVLRQSLAGRFRVSGPLAPGRQQCRVALVGPTGVGKTTTIAKLAGQYRHAGGLTVALLSLDTYRIGAMAQMRIYADLLGLPLSVVRTPAEVRAALAAERGADLLLVDTTGRSPYQAEEIGTTRRLLREIPGLEVHLVVSATTKGADLEEILRRFRPLQYRRVLVTKLDEARTSGPLLGLALRRALVISYLGTGQEVPGDLEAATPRRLASLVFPESLDGRRRAAAGA